MRVTVVSSPEIYTHEWTSFTTKDFPGNKRARSGDLVRIVVTDHQDRRPVEDILWTDESYRSVFGQLRQVNPLKIQEKVRTGFRRMSSSTPKELAFRWKLPKSWIQEQVRSRSADLKAGQCRGDSELLHQNRRLRRCGGDINPEATDA